MSALVACVPRPDPVDGAVPIDAGSDAPPTATGSGTGSYEGFVGRSAMAYPGWDEGITVSSRPDVCETLGRGRDLEPGLQLLGLFATTDPRYGPVPAATYRIGEPTSTGEGTVTFIGQLKHCSPPTGFASYAEVLDGVVAIEETDDSRVRGTYDVGLRGGRLSGTFDAPRCFESGNAVSECAP